MKLLMQRVFTSFVIFISLSFVASTSAQDTVIELENDSTVTFKPLVADTSIVIPLLDFRATKIVDILTALSKQYELNVWIDPKISGLATIRLQDTKLNEIFRFFVEEYDLRVEKNGSLIKVYSPLPVEPKQVVICSDDKITLDVKDIDISEFIYILTDSCGINFIKDKGISGKLNGYIKDVQIESGLNAIFNSNGYSLTFSDGIYYISLLDKSNKSKGATTEIKITDNIVSLNVTNAPLRKVIDNIAKKLNLQLIIYGEIEGSITARCENLSAEKAYEYLLRGTNYTFLLEDSTYFFGPTNMAEITTTKLIKLKHLKADGVIELIPQGIATKMFIKLVKEHNGIMVVGPIYLVNELEKYINEVDHPPAMVLIEAIVVDYTFTDRLDYGIKASSYYLGEADRPGNDYYPFVDVTGSSDGLNRDIRYWADKLDITNIGTLPADFYVRLNALASEGKANIRSKPRIATLSGHEAKIDVGTMQYYLLRTETTYGVGQNTPTNQVSEKFQTIEAAMSLVITPWVNASNEIIATIHTEFNTPVGGFNPDVPPTINHRILDSNVKLRDGETIILGGLIQTSEKETVEKFPILGDIPILGWLFKNKSKIKTISELVIYITPHIYYGSEGSVNISDLED